MSDPTLHRRRFLVLGGTAAVMGLAGCSAASGDGPNDGSEATPTDATETNHSDESDGGHSDGGHDDGHGNDSHDETVGDPVDLAKVQMVSTNNGEHFEPHVVRVTKGGTVRWTNESGSHSTTAYSEANDKPQLMPAGAASWDSDIVSEEGATFEHTFETEGVYHYYCTPHETMGMIASVIVGEPDAHDQPALGEPPEDMPQAVREKIESLNEMCNEALGHGH